MIRTFLIAPLLWPMVGSGASFYEPLPKPVVKTLEAEMPRIREVLAADPDLVKDAGASSVSQLQNSRFDFSKSARLYDLDYRALDKAASVADLLVPTPSYAVPLCVGNVCGTMAMVAWDAEKQSASLRYLGRSVQQAAIQSAAARVAGDPSEEPAKLVTPDTLNMVYVPDKDGGYLVSASKKQEYELAAMAGKKIPEKGVWKMRVADFKAVAEARARIYDEANTDEHRIPEVAEGESLPFDKTENAITPTKNLILPSKSSAAAPSATEKVVDSESTEEPFPWQWGIAILTLISVAGAAFFKFRAR